MGCTWFDLFWMVTSQYGAKCSYHWAKANLLLGICLKEIITDMDVKNVYIMMFITVLCIIMKNGNSVNN